MTAAWANGETFRFIELYQNEPVIWNPRNKDHKDKNKVNDAWNRISDAVGVSVTDIKRKKESLLAAFRLNHKKAITSRMSGAGENETFKPIWIYYDALAAFMADVYDCKSVSTTEDAVSASQEQSDVDDMESVQLLQDMSDSSDAQEGNASKSAGFTIPVTKSRSIQQPELTETKEHVQNVLYTLNNVSSQQQTSECEDECDLYGRLLAKKLRKFSDIDRQQIMYDIDGLLLMKTRSLTNDNRDPSPSLIIEWPNKRSPFYSDDDV